MRTTAGKSRAQKQSKLMYIIWAPMRTLAKARNFYMKGLEDCAGKVSYGGVSGYTASQVPVYLPKSFSVNSSGSSNGEDFSHRMRTAPPKRNSNVEKRNDSNENKAAGSGSAHRIRPVVRKPIVRQPSVKGVGMRRSYSVGLKMGTIDEEVACAFEEDEVNVKADLYPRSRSYAVKRRY